MKKIAILAGARPNFMKIAPLCAELKKHNVRFFVVNTGQHFTDSMSAAFLKEFSIVPDYQLKPSRVSLLSQFASILVSLENIFLKEKPSCVIVVGDVNSTLIGALVAKKLFINLVHVESGLRSFNTLMPEETNRVLTDHLADILFTTDSEGIKNLEKEGLGRRAYLVGNIMIDTLKQYLPKKHVEKEGYYYCTLHRAENIGNQGVFKEILATLSIISKDAKIYMPLHPHTKKMADKFGLIDSIKKVFTILPPLSYSESLAYQRGARMILTDSGGIQEEASYLGIPCVTLRTETERPITLKLGTNVIGGIKQDSILKAYKSQMKKRYDVKIPLWDGNTAKRIFKILKKYSYV